VTFKVIQGHCQWCHSIGRMRFPSSVPLQLMSRSRTVKRWYCHLFPEI